MALLSRQFTSPIILILLGAALLSLLLDSPTDALIILAIVLMSGLLGFWQERSAARGVAELVKRWFYASPAPKRSSSLL